MAKSSYNIIMKTLVLALIILISKNLFASDCKLKKELTVKDLNPFTMQKMFSDPKIKNITDIMCCLPQEFRDDLKVINHSRSLQTGLRVLFGNFDKHGIMLSISGEIDKNSHGRNAIEMITIDPIRDHIKKTFEGSFNKLNQFKIESNPTKCLGCHAGTTKPGQASKTELRLVFENEPWLRVNNTMGLSNHDSDDLPEKCKPINRYLKLRGEYKRKKALELDRFKCINHNLIRNSVTRFGEEAEITKHDYGRKNRILKQHNFDKYRFAIYGLRHGCFTKNNRENINFSNWLPNYLLQKRSSNQYPKPVENMNLKQVFDKRKSDEDSDRAHLAKITSKINGMTDKQLELATFDDMNAEKIVNACESYEDMRVQFRKYDNSKPNEMFGTAKPIKYTNTVDSWLKKQPELFQNHLKDSLGNYIDEFELPMNEAIENYFLDLAGINRSDLSELYDRSEFRRSFSNEINFQLNPSTHGIPEELILPEFNSDNLTQKQCQQLAKLSKNELEKTSINRTNSHKSNEKSSSSN